MYRAKQNLRAYNVTYKKGESYEAPLPKGYEHCFEKISIDRKSVEINEQKVETASLKTK